MNTVPPSEDFNTNVLRAVGDLQTENILQARFVTAVCWIILDSSVAVYESRPAEPFHEEMPLQVNSCVQRERSRMERIAAPR